MRYPIDHLIQRHLDGEMSDAERVEFEQLLANSSEAREELRRAEQLRSAVRRAATVRQPSAWVEAELLSMIRAQAAPAPPSIAEIALEVRPPVRGGRMRRVASTFAAVACILLLALEISDGPLTTTGSLAERDSITPTGPTAPLVAELSGQPSSAPTLIRRYRTVLNNSRTERVQPTVPVQRQSGDVEKTSAVPYALDATESSSMVAYSNASVKAESAASIASNSFPTIDLPDNWTPPLAEHASLLNASVRGGYAGIRRDDWVAANEMQVRLGLRLGEQDQLYAVVGSAPTITETRYRSAGLAVSAARSRDDEANGKADDNKRGNTRLLSTTPPELLVSFDDELWGGVGYRRTLLEQRGMQLAASAQAGTSGTAARFSGEISGSIRVLPGLSLEVSSSVTQVLPFAREVEISNAIDAEDRMLYNGTVRQPAFISVGAQVGVRVDLP